MHASSSSDQLVSDALNVQSQRREICADRAVALLYGSTVSIAMLGWLYALGMALRGGIVWALS